MERLILRATPFHWSVFEGTALQQYGEQLNSEKKTVLFVCTGNAGRSQMAEELFRRAYGEFFEVRSAGVDPWRELHPVGRTLMEESGFSMDGHAPKHVRSVDFSEIDVVVTIGAPAERGTRDLRGGKVHVHWDLGDPAAADGTDDSLAIFERTKKFIEGKIAILAKMLAGMRRLDDFCRQPALATGFFKDTDANIRFSPAEHVPILAAKGFKLIELSAYIPEWDFPWCDDGKIDELLKVCEDNGIAIWSAHPPENMILLGNDAAARHQNLEMLRRFSDFCNRIGAAYMPIHFWSTTRTLEEVADERFLDFLLDELESISRDSNVTLCLETLRSNVSKVSNFELLEIVKSRSENLGLLIDSGHSHISGDLHETIVQAGKNLKSLHLHDNDGVNDLHLPPGEGSLDWTRLANDLSSVDYTGPIMYEVGFISADKRDAALDAIMENYKQFFLDK